MVAWESRIMSKCDCGADTNGHIIFKCKASEYTNKINGNKDLYDRMCAWMADEEDSSFLEETMSEDEVDKYLVSEAGDIFYQIYGLCEG